VTPVVVGSSTVEVVVGDITREHVDAIVNAANEALAPGGGVCGAIHRAAGPALADECRRVAPCPTGDARITGGYSLPARHVIHAVGPVSRGRPADATLLAGAYTSSLGLLAAHGLTSIAFPAISTGIYGYPLEEATGVALRAIGSFLQSSDASLLVRLVCFDRATADVYERLAPALLAT
jgi:O-acetyl-ADP-ribose deacetylase (regulator of RNase III)